ncbi:SPOR domain-containing protein [Gymnodinialimonas ceratoperidinii]|uniref:SPOR domain-containing protein n=1 Tax=Gymnodinialimonas ceratoperidinii TaxID=2856823 RepID=A0A8F6YAK0_9RHOB|nr:SPOR domain-containing protein [Gymnodinialimonas ceratoperidinii]QXT39081.1 SPOR domain-containing protein [Gymnodinialimonas ceratoperidinii]
MTLFRQTPRFRAFSLALVPVIALSGCVEEGGLFSSRDADADGPAPIGATRLVERDVEAPEVFEVTTEGLWDGRPSLGGVWVAHPDVTDPERVIIRNDENGRFVIGALFRRERDNPGPELQISSDAAAAIGALAGDPTMLNVTALRREEVAETAEAAPEAMAPGEDIAASLAAAEITATPLDGADSTIASAAAAIDAAETAPAAPAAARTPAAGAPERPYIQIGIFSVQENATNTGQALRSVGLEPTIYDQTTNGRQFWRVVVGPADSTQTRDAILANVQDLGFDDAFFVRR